MAYSPVVRSLYSIVLLFFVGEILSAQTLQRVDPLEAGFAGSTTARTGSGWFVHRNPATLPTVKGGSLLGSYSPSALGIEGYREGAFIGSMSFGESLSVGLNGAAFGTGAYSESAGGIVAATQLEQYLRVGATLLLQSVSIEQYGSNVIPLLDIGTQVQVSPEAVFGASFVNVTRSAVSDQDIPQRLSLGFAWTPDSTLSLSADIVQELRHDLGFAIGVEVEPIENIPVRGGIASEPSTVGFGVGFRTGNIIVDYGGSWVDPLGFRHVFGAGITW
ncbi:MAG: hypothetical protein KDD67_16000 [Ignavibacteriae bacterium]|nr:hypothetical protein [Ignavibacteriota bacterium]MCB9215674.1 hypothetical protein [Ignavibacteria bacterium]